MAQAQNDNSVAYGARNFYFDSVTNTWQPVNGSSGSIAVSLSGSLTVTSTPLSTIQHTSVTVSTTPTEITAISNQKLVRLYATSQTTTVAWGTVSSVTGSIFETFNQSTPLSIATNSSVWVVATGGSVIVSVYRGS